MFEGIFGFIGLACGIYCLYGFFMLKYKKIINRTILLPKGVDAGKCKDLEGYSREASLPLLLLGFIVTVYGAVDLYNIYVERIPKGLYSNDHSRNPGPLRICRRDTKV